MPVQAHSSEPLPEWRHRDWRQFCPDEWQMYSSLVRWITVPALATQALFLYSRVHRTALDAPVQSVPPAGRDDENIVRSCEAPP
jgi:hypothetical protein